MGHFQYIYDIKYDKGLKLMIKILINKVDN